MVRKKSKKRRQRPLRAESLEARRCLTASLGWDGPGQGSAELSYYIGNAPSGVEQAAFESAIETALDVWSDVVDVQFTETSRAGERDSIDFTSVQIDGPGGTLAQAYLPDDVNNARIAGDIQFDVDESWEVGNDQGRAAFDLVQVAVHELGHALGLDHINHSGSVLAPYVSPTQQFSSLSTEDIDAALEIYAPAVVDSTPSSPAPSNPPTSESTTSPNTPVQPEITPAPEASPQEDEVATGDEATTELDPANEEGRPDAHRDRPWRRFWKRGGFWIRFGGNALAAPANHNPISHSDVNGDGGITPLDAIIVINHMFKPMNTGDAVDTNGDGRLTPLDALLVIEDFISANGGFVRPGIMDTYDAQGEATDLVGIGSETPSTTIDEVAPTVSDDEVTTIGEEQPANEEAGADETEQNAEPTPETDADIYDANTTINDETPQVETADDETSTPPVDDAETDDDDESTDETTAVTDEGTTTVDDMETTETDDEDSEPETDTETDTTGMNDDHEECPIPSGIAASGLIGWGASRLFTVLDTNDDDSLTEAEVGSALWRLVQPVDANADGSITMDEVQAFVPSRGGNRFSRLDDNGDGSITVDEVNESIWGRLAPADADNDGAVSQEELDAYRDSLPSRRFQRLDDNSDGMITQDEVTATTWEYLVEMDTNQDGAITPNEAPEPSRPRPKFRFARNFRLPRLSFFLR